MNHLKNAQWMKNRGHHVLLVCTKNSPLHVAALKCELSIIAIRKPSKHYAFLSAFLLQKILLRKGVEHVFIRSTFDLSLAASLSFFSRKRLKTHYFMEMMFHQQKRQFFRTIRYASLTSWICSLDYMKSFVLRYTHVPAQKVKIIPSGLDFSTLSHLPKTEARKQLNLPQDVPIFGMIGRIDRKKRIELAIKALNELKNEPFHLLIVGEETPDSKDTYLDDVKRLISQSGLEKRIHFFGFHEDPYPFYRAIDALIMASDFETFGMSTIEAFAHDTPVIASDNGGSKELLTQFPHGALFKAGDFLSLSAAMSQLPDFSNQHLSKEAFRAVFDHDRVCEMVETSILSLDSLR